MIPVWKTARAKKEWNLPHEFSWQKVSMTKPKVDWWSSQDLVSRGSMCNTDHHFQVKTKVSPVNWKGWQVRNTSSIYIHLILNKVIVNGHWPLRCDNFHTNHILCHIQLWLLQTDHVHFTLCMATIFSPVYFPRCMNNALLCQTWFTDSFIFVY